MAAGTLLRPSVGQLLPVDRQDESTDPLAPSRTSAASTRRATSEPPCQPALVIDSSFPDFVFRTGRPRLCRPPPCPLPRVRHRHVTRLRLNEAILEPNERRSQGLIWRLDQQHTWHSAQHSATCRALKSIQNQRRELPLAVESYNELHGLCWFRVLHCRTPLTRRLFLDRSISATKHFPHNSCPFGLIGRFRLARCDLRCVARFARTTTGLPQFEQSWRFTGSTGYLRSACVWQQHETTELIAAAPPTPAACGSAGVPPRSLAAGRADSSKEPSVPLA